MTAKGTNHEPMVAEEGAHPPTKPKRHHHPVYVKEDLRLKAIEAELSKRSDSNGSSHAAVGSFNGASNGTPHGTPNGTSHGTSNGSFNNPTAVLHVVRDTGEDDTHGTVDAPSVEESGADLSFDEKLARFGRLCEANDVHISRSSYTLTHSNPYTLTPYTLTPLHPTPYTLHSCTLHPTPYTLHSCTLYPTLLHPTPYTLRPYTLHLYTLHPTP